MVTGTRRIIWRKRKEPSISDQEDNSQSYEAMATHSYALWIDNSRKLSTVIIHLDCSFLLLVSRHIANEYSASVFKTLAHVI